MDSSKTPLEEARLIARRVVAGLMDPNEACALIAEVCVRGDWPTELLAFSALAHEQDGHEALGFDRKNTAPLIVDACETLLATRHPKVAR